MKIVRWCVLMGVGNGNQECILYNAQLCIYIHAISNVERTLHMYIKFCVLLKLSMKE